MTALVSEICYSCCSIYFIAFILKSKDDFDLQGEEMKQLKESYNKERRRQLESLENRESDLMSQFRLHLSNAKKSLSDKIDRLQKKNDEVISSYVFSFELYCTTHHWYSGPKDFVVINQHQMTV